MASQETIDAVLEVVASQYVTAIQLGMGCVSFSAVPLTILGTNSLHYNQQLAPALRLPGLFHARRLCMPRSWRSAGEEHGEHSVQERHDRVHWSRVLLFCWVGMGIWP